MSYIQLNVQGPACEMMKPYQGG